ncbi:MAG: single-stranded DNA-binding protein [Chloroflexi bacterium]|nr:single-stranded DNA-binding protein [Chloroflexota bacterium]
MTWHQTIVVGNLGGDPELRYLQSGQAVCNFSVAVTERWRDRQTNEQREKTTWYRVAVWGAQGENCNTYLSRGRQVMVIGNVSARGYVNNNGEAAASLDLTAREVRFLSSRGDGDQGGGGGQRGGGQRGGSSGRGGQRGDAQRSDRASNYPDSPQTIDDIPF